MNIDTISPLKQSEKSVNNCSDISPRVSRIPAFDDNYIWFIHGLANLHAEQQIIIVDPGEAAPVIEAIKANDYQPQAIFITHHHADHTGGISELLKTYNIPVYGPQNETIESINFTLNEELSINMPDMGLSFDVLDVPGHTRGHIAYVGHHLLFIGDTLFAGGCGRIFEGTSEQMHHSLAKLLKLSDETMVYCAHEYTTDNLVFAQRVEPDNQQLQQRIEDTQILRNNNQSTVPSNLALEKQTNPFLRFDMASVRSAAENFAGHPLTTPAEVFKTVRYWKDTLD
ncbi:hydroxyacylglutathione hydrolase [sulfur-oxidizing endosymbiont of Gigantopelta aegis]|uniref:hydroxyacylglutathione hydrolase n=1 Tax=sulfur-oxidizing endosymbiont of Gigantopelta aegis TaxID=2794934 RepID=UPI0018DD69DA|nr:hydroxyacylglutathione hydrolase [sulfur-oxidizing endosymbiont of Gigantopelta aegis]